MVVMNAAYEFQTTEVAKNFVGLEKYQSPNAPLAASEGCFASQSPEHARLQPSPVCDSRL
jgi:hypothetical protein